MEMRNQNSIIGLKMRADAAMNAMNAMSAVTIGKSTESENTDLKTEVQFLLF